MPRSLAELEARLAYNLACLNYPPPNWVIPTPGVVDVVVIGAGMSGLVAAFALLRRGIRAVRILDRAPAGAEGPWVTFARMETLRSPKELVGPAADIPAMTFRAWFTAQHGEAAWEALFRIPRPMWMDYLKWYRAVLSLSVENGVDVLRIAPSDGQLRLDLGDGRAIDARKVVLATGRAGLGRAAIPAFIGGASREPTGRIPPMTSISRRCRASGWWWSGPGRRRWTTRRRRWSTGPWRCECWRGAPGCPPSTS